MNRVLAERMVEQLKEEGCSVTSILKRVSATEDQETVFRMYQVSNNGNTLEQIKKDLISFFQEEIKNWNTVGTSSSITQQQFDGFLRHNDNNRISQENSQRHIDDAIRNHNHN